MEPSVSRPMNKFKCSQSHSKNRRFLQLTVLSRKDKIETNYSPMKKTSLVTSLLLLAPMLMAADAPPAAPSWHAQTLLSAIGNVLLFAAIGVAAAIIGFKLFDKFTPGHLEKEIIEHRNIAAAIVAAAVILGVSIIIAATMLG